MCRLLASRYGWDANQVAELTPAQGMAYAQDCQRDHEKTVKAIYAGAERSGTVDRRFPGKQIISFKSIGEWRAWQQTRA